MALSMGRQSRKLFWGLDNWKGELWVLKKACIGCHIHFKAHWYSVHNM